MQGELTKRDYEILQQTIADFTYRADAEQWGQREHWHIHKGSGPFTDDCDGFALSLAYRLAGSDDDKMRRAFQEGVAAIVRVRTPFSIDGSTHAVLRWKGYYVDNIIPVFRPPAALGDGWSYIKTFDWKIVAAKIIWSRRPSLRSWAVPVLLGIGLLYVLITSF